MKKIKILRKMWTGDSRNNQLSNNTIKDKFRLNRNQERF